MGKRVTSRKKSNGKNALTSSVNRRVKKEEKTTGDTALDLVQVYEAVERSYRAAVMAGETHAGVAFSTNY